jgi:hypothetical protein
MKQIPLFVILTLLFANINAQDYLYKSDGEKIAVKIIENDGSTLTYRLFESRDQSVKTIPLVQVYMIDYEGIGIEYTNRENQNSNSQELTNQIRTNDNNEINNKNIDVINFIDGNSVKGIITEVNKNYIAYKLPGTNQPIQKVSVNDVLTINYLDGRMQTFNYNEPVTQKNISNYPQQEPIENIFSDASKVENEVTSSNSYFGMGMGYGNSYGGGGIKLQYVFDSNLKIGFHVGGGYYFDELNFNANKLLAYSAGIQFFVWKGLYLNSQFGGFGIYNRLLTDYSSYYKYEKQLLYGPSILLGYEHFLSESFGFGLAAGSSYNINNIYKVFYALDFGIIYQF